MSVWHKALVCLFLCPLFAEASSRWNSDAMMAWAVMTGILGVGCVFKGVWTEFDLL